MPKGKNNYQKLSQLPEWKRQVIDIFETLAKQKKYFTTHEVLCLATQQSIELPFGATSIGAVIQFMRANDYFYFTPQKKKVKIENIKGGYTTLLKSHLFVERKNDTQN